MNKQEYACFKRCLEYFQIDPDFRTMLYTSPRDAIASLAFPVPLNYILVAEAIQAIIYGTNGTALPETNPYLTEYIHYYTSVHSYIQRRYSSQHFRSESIYQYINITLNRSGIEQQLIRDIANIRYIPMCFELSQGCTVQCPFCGFSAKRYQNSFLYTSENRTLWRNMLQDCKDFLGNILNTCICYFATEPMDNPDYEAFLLDMRDIAGAVPQTTTALADRYPQRLKSLMAELGEVTLMQQCPLRFSIRSLPHFHKIMSLYTPEELIYVELLPNNPESISHYASSGKVMENPSYSSKELNYSLCCVSGIKVNMVEKSISFIEPVSPDSDYPLGYRCLETQLFTARTDFISSVRNMFEQYAHATLPLEHPLMLNKRIQVKPYDGKLYFIGDNISYCMSMDYTMKMTLSYLEQGYSAAKCIQKLGLFGSLADNLYMKLHQLYVRGYLCLR